ncbi:IS5/IS1182 family transposase [Archaeoglobales archaeon]|nr:MAG: IS5/IS1182 family transposase [Archaeoglobales archaeon]
MEIPLVVCQRDFRWKLLSKILKVFDLRKVKKIIARYTLKAVPILKIVTTSMFFSTRISHVINELRNKKDLREFIGIKKEEIPKASYVYSFLSKFSLKGFINMILRILNSITKRRQRNSKLIVDCTDVSVDLNWFRKPIKQSNLLRKDYKWGYSAKGKFIGMKLTLVMENPCKPLLFLLHPANRHEAKLFKEVMDELKRRRILRKKDVILMDKGFYAYGNYLIGINRYRIVPLIFPRSNFRMERLDSLLSYPLSVFNSKNLARERRLFKALKAKLLNLLKNWESYKSERSLIEDVFKLAKSMSLRKLHRYTMKSVYKFAAVNVLLVGLIVALGFKEKKVLQRLAES